MKNFKYLLPVALIAFASCSPATRSPEDNVAKTDVSANAASGQTPLEKAVYARLLMKDTIGIAEPIPLRFTVYNTTDSVQKFLKWHTPFEPWISKYLDIKDENGVEVSYKGAMAKRMMPPPAESYMKINPMDSVSAEADLSKGYAISKAGRYTVIYNSQNVSGLLVKDSVVFVYGK